MISFDSRPRNATGQFTPTDQSGVTPASAAKAYGPGAIAGAAGLGVGGTLAAKALLAKKGKKLVKLGALTPGMLRLG
jgi:hypothetical protein